MVFETSIYNRIPVSNQKTVIRRDKKPGFQLESSKSGIFKSEKSGLASNPFDQFSIQPKTCENFNKDISKGVFNPFEIPLLSNLSNFFKTNPVQKPTQTLPAKPVNLEKETCEVGSFAKSIIKMIDKKDAYTGLHSQAVQKYAEVFAKHLNLPQSQREVIRLGAAFHDVGKIGVPAVILNKSSKLSDEDFDQIKQHPVAGDEILEEIPAFKGTVSKVARHHHENWDGSGYPDKLAGSQIPLEARLVAIIDSYHAMTSDRPYRKGMPTEKAISIFKDGAGKQWDPALVAKFIEIIPSLSEA